MHPDELDRTLDQSRRFLLALRRPDGHWEGELSSSALSTATAIVAIEAFVRAGGQDARLSGDRLRELIERGRHWLAAHQNCDGGWGDTVASLSNISTTALAWAALDDTAPQADSTAAAAAAAWLTGAAGDLRSPVLARAIRNRYGEDHTFSVPILTTLALTGRLGPPRDAWRHVPQLPFELAAFPHRWFAALRLPVVSYALPALIAIGQVRHAHRPTRNPVLRLLRTATRNRTLRVLRSIQPAGGGFLEATPLTAFVTLSLIGAGRKDDEVVREGLGFLARSARTDGSWPIDTNLATWLTTLSINALSAAGSISQSMTDADIGRVRRWMLDQQYTRRHPYTHAPPGGWAWTDLPGGVPDADDTAGALLALRALDDGSAEVRASATAAVGWLVDLQNSDGGIPTFCRGWGNLPFDRSSADLTAHAVRAWLAWSDALPDPPQRATRRALGRAVDYLLRVQQDNGAWAPLWFGNQHADGEQNLTYGTSRVVLALAELQNKPAPVDARCESATRRAAGWLLSVQNPDGGFGGDRRTPSSIEETALAIEAFCAVLDLACGPDHADDSPSNAAIQAAMHSSVAWLCRKTDLGRRFPASPIGFYFAKLWYFEQLYPVIYTLSALGRADRQRKRMKHSSVIPRELLR